MTDKGKAKTAVQRMAKMASNKKAAGLTQLTIWTKPKYKEDIKKYAKKLNK